MSLPSSEAVTDVVTTEFIMISISGAAEESVAATLRYGKNEPFLVRATFTLPGGRGVDWVLARDLLREGVALPTGLGDVRIFPGDDGLLLELRSHQGRAFLYGPIEPFIDFVRDMYALVPEDTESDHFAIDAVLESLLDTCSDDPDRYRTDSA